DLELTMPSTSGAHLYAYGGEKGGVTVRRSPFKVAATNIGENRSFEIRLLLPREALPNAQGQSGSWSLAALKAMEDSRIAKELSRANSRWIAHWALLLALMATVGLYWFTVRRASPEPDPHSLTVEQLTAIPPAAVGWIYDSSWFDFACAQLMHLEAQGVLIAERGSLHMTLRRKPGATLDPADETLLSLFFITEEPIEVPAIADKWQAHKGRYEALAADWLKLVQQQVPPEWFSRPSPLWAWISGAVCIVMGVISTAWMEWIALWALGGLMIFMGYKRRWLSPLGESYIARWVATYYAAVRSGRKSDGPGVPAPYLLAVEVGDDHLERAMGADRYEIVKSLYLHLEELA
ncbi:MAG TPA: hypothetical protein VNT75_01510, partial [Symbiobacteriaceae bacterium]|nr:hypothetical protein [Symbiobacteriaceae bacterium]